MGIDRIHDFSWLCSEKGRTPARSIDAAMSARLYSRDCNGLMINSEVFGARSSFRRFAAHENLKPSGGRLPCLQSLGKGEGFSVISAEEFLRRTHRVRRSDISLRL